MTKMKMKGGVNMIEYRLVTKCDICGRTVSKVINGKSMFKYIFNTQPMRIGLPPGWVYYGNNLMQTICDKHEIKIDNN